MVIVLFAKYPRDDTGPVTPADQYPTGQTERSGMRIAVQVPIKAESSRIPGKNFRDMAGRPLWQWMMETLSDHVAPIADIFVETDVPELREQCADYNAEYLERPEWLGSPWVNGNHLLHSFAVRFPDYDLYAQCFVTAPCLRGETIATGLTQLSRNTNLNCFGDGVEMYNCLLVGRLVAGWFWHKGAALNYDAFSPAGLPKSQDAQVFRESTGLYAVTRNWILQHGTRIGDKPWFILVSEREAIDIDTPEDWRLAESVLRKRGGK